RRDLDLRLAHFTEASSLSTWLSERKGGDFLCLIDYELLHEAATGLDLIEREGIAPQSILVTGRFGEASILSRCQALGLRVIPKELVGQVPVVCADPPAAGPRTAH